MSETIFGLICSRLPHPENAASEALRHILGNSSVAARAFNQLIRECGFELPELVMFESQSVTPECGIPDLSCLDKDGEKRVLVENKFWAGLTENQPVAYLRLLPEGKTGVLLFVVPEARRTFVWSELILRCRNAGMPLQNASNKSVLDFARVTDLHCLAITSWPILLGRLEGALLASNEHTRATDVAQLRGLCAAMDSQEFLPLLPEELTNLDLPRRIMDLSDLVQAISEAAVQEGICRRDKLNPAHNWYTAGRYLKIGNFGMWLGIDARQWRRLGVSPLWCVFGGDDFGKPKMVRELLRGWQVDDAQHVYDDDPYAILPIILKCGAEKQAVVKYAVSQLRELRTRLDLAEQVI